MPDDPRLRPDFHFEDPLYTTPGLDPALYWWLRYPDPPPGVVAQPVIDVPNAPPPGLPPPIVQVPNAPPPGVETPPPYVLEQLPNRTESDVRTVAPPFGIGPRYELPEGKGKTQRELERAIMRDGARRGRPFYQACEDLGMGGGDSAMAYCDEEVISVDEYDRIRRKAGWPDPVFPRAQPRRANLIDSRRGARAPRPDELDTGGDPVVIVPRARARTRLPRPRTKSDSAEVVLARFPRGPYPVRPPVRRRETIPQRRERVEQERIEREAARRERARTASSRRSTDEVLREMQRRAQQRIPPPLPDELAPYPVRRTPRVIEFPQPDPVPELSPVPVPQIPAPAPPRPVEVPTREPAPVGLPLPAPGRVTRRQRQTVTPRPRRQARVPQRRVVFPVSIAAALGVSSILQRARAVRGRLSLPARLPNPVAEALTETIAEALPIAMPSAPAAPPTVDVATLTSFNTPSVGLRQRRQRCKCPKCEKPKKPRKAPSNVIAQVKNFTRRMSRNSLKNLRR